MADRASSGSHHHGLEEHRQTYEGFVKGSIALALICAFVLVALVAFRFVSSGNVVLGFGGLFLGTLAVVIDARTGSRWFMSLGLLAAFGLVTAAAIS